MICYDCALLLCDGLSKSTGYGPRSPVNTSKKQVYFVDYSCGLFFDTRTLHSLVGWDHMLEMAGSTDEKWRADKLDGSNWTTWKFQMRHLLLAKGLWGLVDGTDELAEGASDVATREFRQKAQKAFSTIIMAIGTPQLYLVTPCEEPKEAWGNLCGHFERETLANKLFLKKQYFRTEMKEGTSVEAHLKQIKEITDRLAAIGAPISEEDQVVTLLGSLPPSYSNLVTALESRIDSVKLSYVQQALIHEEMKRHEQPSHSSPSSPTNSALLGTHEKGSPRRAVRCFGCGRFGHIRRFCRAEKRNYDNTEPAHKAKIAEEFEGDGVFAAVTGPIQPSQMDTWLVDSGASTHVTREKELLLDYREFEKPEMVGLGDGKSVEAVGVGTVCMKMLFRVSTPMQCVLQDVLYVPRLACNLFSVRAAAAKGNTVKFGHEKCWIRDGDGKLKGKGTVAGKLYRLDCEPNTVERASVASQLRSYVDLWHQWFGHLNGQQLERIAQKDLVTGVKIPQQVTLSFCEGCVEGKMHRAPFKPGGEIRSTRRLQLVHSDVCGPMQTKSLGGRKYFAMFIDDYSRCCNVYF